MPRQRALALLVAGGLASLALTALSPAAAVPAGAAVPAASAAPGGPGEGDARRGREVFATGCSSCHGLRAEGTGRGPSLLGVGAASVDFWLSTGRMPLKTDTRQAVRKPPELDRREIDDVTAYVTSLKPGGPARPTLDVAHAGLVEGGELFRSNCAACHGAVGIGGALASGRRAPPLRPATAVQVAEAIRIGPGAMPSFGPETFTDDQVAAIVRYVEQLVDHPDDRGGSGLGHTGPIPEGFVGWLVGLGALLVACYWIGERE